MVVKGYSSMQVEVIFWVVLETFKSKGALVLI